MKKFRQIVLTITTMLVAVSVSASLPSPAADSAKSSIDCTQTQPCSVEVSGSYYSNFATITAVQDGITLSVEFEIDTLAFPDLGFSSTNVTIRYGDTVEIVRTKDHNDPVALWAEQIDLSGYDIPPTSCLTFQASVEVEDPISVDELSSAELALPTSVPMTVSSNGTSGYLTANIEGDSILAGSFDAWCVDIDTTIFYGTDYIADVYSSFDGLEALSPYVDKPENLDKVNWIINQSFVGATAGDGQPFTSCDVQRAVWTLIDNNAMPSCGTTTPSHVTEILAGAAASGAGYVPGCGNFVAVVLVPRTIAGVDAQVIIAQSLVIGEAAPCRTTQDSAIIQFCCCLDGEAGCTRTQGYWKTHASGKKYDETWDAVGGPDAEFFSSEMTYLEVMKAPSKNGNAYFILAQQYIAAKLNIAAGAWPIVGESVLAAEAKFLATTPDQAADLSQEERAVWIALATILDDYNNGELGAPHCD